MLGGTPRSKRKRGKFLVLLRATLTARGVMTLMGSSGQTAVVLSPYIQPGKDPTGSHQTHCC